MNLDSTTRLMLRLYTDHLADEPNQNDYPSDDGHAQAAYWAAYDEWQAVGYGLRMMLGGRLIRLVELEVAS